MTVRLYILHLGKIDAYLNMTLKPPAPDTSLILVQRYFSPNRGLHTANQSPQISSISDRPLSFWVIIHI